MPKTKVNFEQICQRLKKAKLPACELVVGIAEGGVVPAALCAARMDCPLNIVRINYRGQDNRPCRDHPVVLSKRPALASDLRRILLVDDASITEQTLNAAKGLFAGYQLSTLVLKGKADYVLFPELNGCAHWPWQAR